MAVGVFINSQWEPTPRKGHEPYQYPLCLYTDTLSCREKLFLSCHRHLVKKKVPPPPQKKKKKKEAKTNFLPSVGFVLLLPKTKAHLIIWFLFFVVVFFACVWLFIMLMGSGECISFYLMFLSGDLSRLVPTHHCML